MDFTTYGGDQDRILYLDKGVTGNVQLCLQAGWGSAGVLHLTSTDEAYRDWLYKHFGSLLLIAEDQWYVDSDGRTYYREFHYILDKLVKVCGYVENR